MFLSKTSTIIIMRVGHWSSKAFLEYIREQVQDFTAGISENTIKFEAFVNMNIFSLHPKKTVPDNENGPEAVQFQVEFSELALSNTSRGRFTRLK